MLLVLSVVSPGSCFLCNLSIICRYAGVHCGARYSTGIVIIVIFIYYSEGSDFTRSSDTERGADRVRGPGGLFFFFLF